MRKLDIDQRAPARKTTKVVVLNLDHEKIDAEKARFDLAVKTIVSLGRVSKRSAIAFLEYEWYRVPPPHRQPGGEASRTQLNEAVLQFMHERRAAGDNKSQVIASALDAIKDKDLVPKDKRRGLGETTLKDRYLPMVFGLPKKRKTRKASRFLLKLRVAGTRKRAARPRGA
ncbi:MAG: hypothetical protein WA190_17665 [Usitatibacter sp.]